MKKNIFADKASIILRMMLHDPKRKWVVRDFCGQTGVSIGMAQEVLESMSVKGYVERVKKGPHSYTVLTNPDRMIHNWLMRYSFELNETRLFYSPDSKILYKIKKHLNNKEYALTLHTGANMITSYVKTDNVYFYLNYNLQENEILKIRQKLDLKELKNGGNVYMIRPYYKNSVFFNARKIGGFSVVSNLQLYLDLYNFQPRGREHAEHLKGIIYDTGKRLS